MSILCYHAVDPSWDSPLSMSPAGFERHCSWLARRRRMVDIDTAVAKLDKNFRLPPGMSTLTFDDGFASLYDHALPTLRRHLLPGVVFLVAETLTDRGRVVDWVTPPPAVPPATLTVEQVLEMQEAGVSFQSHSCSHHDLPLLSEEECQRDLRTSRELLEEVLGRRVPYLAYPRGLHDDHVQRAAARAGYRNSFTLPEKKEAAGPHSIPRVGVYPQNGSLALMVKTSHAYLPLRTTKAFVAVRPLVRAARARALSQMQHK